MDFNRRGFLARLPIVAAGATALLNPEAILLGEESRPNQLVEREFLKFRAQDGVPSWGLYYRPKGKNPKTAVLITHPRLDYTDFFLTTRLAERGYAVLGQASRWLNDDSRAIQESTLLDIAASIKFLQENYRVERIISVGHSGGGGLFAYYQAQATISPPGRFSSTVAGDPPDLNQFDLPPLDGFIALAAHKGEGLSLLSRLDPAVVDESDPLASDWTLDMFDPRNGYRQPPESSKYSAEFRTRYVAAQLERAKRLDAKAYALLDRQRRAQRRIKSQEFARLDPLEQMRIRRTAYHEEYMIVYRTAARLSLTDLSIDPSDRKVGVVGSTDPETGNYGPGGLSCVTTPRAYLSTWSGLSSRMTTDQNLAKITIPAIVIGGTSDTNVTPGANIRSTFEVAAAKDKTIVFVKGATHWFTPEQPAAEGKDTQDEAARIIADWLRPRFPV